MFEGFEEFLDFIPNVMDAIMLNVAIFKNAMPHEDRYLTIKFDGTSSRIHRTYNNLGCIYLPRPEKDWMTYLYTIELRIDYCIGCGYLQNIIHRHKGPAMFSFDLNRLNEQGWIVYGNPIKNGVVHIYIDVEVEDQLREYNLDIDNCWNDLIKFIETIVLSLKLDTLFVYRDIKNYIRITKYNNGHLIHTNDDVFYVRFLKYIDSYKPVIKIKDDLGYPLSLKLDPDIIDRYVQDFAPIRS